MLKKILLLVTLVLFGLKAFCQEYPARSNTIVTDYTNTLSADQRQQLENKLVAFDDSTSSQVAIVIIKSTGDYDINQYGAGLIRNWGIGQKGKNNGVLILVAIADRKVAIQTGYGMEGVLPDITTHEIIRDDITPRFKQGDYYEGLDAAVDDIIKVTKGEYKADKKAKKDSGGGGVSVVVILTIIVIILVSIFKGRGGGGGHIIGGRGSASPFWWFLGGAMLGRGSGGWGGFSGGGGGFGGGSDSGGGGGFGGFGGGDSGGGGSSGSW